MRTGLRKQEKTTEIWFDEKNPTIYVRTHNTDLKKRLAAFAVEHPDCCKRMGKEERHFCIVKFYGKRAIFVIRIFVINQAKCRKHSQFKSGKKEFCVI